MYWIHRMHIVLRTFVELSLLSGSPTSCLFPKIWSSASCIARLHFNVGQSMTKQNMKIEYLYLLHIICIYIYLHSFIYLSIYWCNSPKKWWTWQEPRVSPLKYKIGWICLCPGLQWSSLWLELQKMRQSLERPAQAADQPAKNLFLRLCILGWHHYALVWAKYFICIPPDPQRQKVLKLCQSKCNPEDFLNLIWAGQAWTLASSRSTTDNRMEWSSVPASASAISSSTAAFLTSNKCLANLWTGKAWWFLHIRMAHGRLSFVFYLFRYVSCFFIIFHAMFSLVLGSFTLTILTVSSPVHLGEHLHASSRADLLAEAQANAAPQRTFTQSAKHWKHQSAKQC